MSYKINIKAFFISMLIIFFAFQRVIVEYINFFSYIDELFAIYVIFAIFIKMIQKKFYVNKKEISILLLLILLIFIGILSNLKSGILSSKFQIIVDIISIIKVWISFYYIFLIDRKTKFYDNILINLSKIFRFIVLIMFICLIISQFYNIGMSAGVRYGFKSFKFLFNNPGNYSKLFYFIIPLLTADLHYKDSKYKKVMIFISLIIWFFTLRSRAISFIVIYIFLLLLFFKLSNLKIGQQIKKIKKNKIKIWYLLPILIVALILSWKQITFYFTTSTQARSVLLRYGIITAKKYFPLGSGFGTYGSDVAANNYSLLYQRYNFNSYYGMREGEEMFLNDNYWPMIIGQFGIIGTLLVVIVLYIFTRNALSCTKNNRLFYFSTFIALLFLLLSSVASKSYSEFSSICIFILIGIFVKRERSIE